MSILDFFKKKPRKEMSDEMFKNAMIGIDALRPKPSYKSDSDPKPGSVLYSKKVDVSEYDKWSRTSVFPESSAIRHPSFSEHLMELVQKKGITNRQFYKNAGISRKLFSAMKNNPNYRPKKETAVACCFGLGLTLDESEKLLGLAGYKLSLSIGWDRVIYYCLSNDISDIFLVNELLSAKGEKCIRA